MLKRWINSFHGIFIACVVVANLLASAITALIWMPVSARIALSDSEVLLLLPLVISIMLEIPIVTAVSRYSTKPLENLVHATQAVSAGDFSVRVEETGTGEVHDLLHNFNRMTMELGSAERMRNDFINTFSHEFRTPIGSIRGFAKRLRNKNLTPERRAEYLKYIEEEAERLSRLSNSVLLISRYENQVLIADRQEYELDEQIRNCVLRQESRWEARRLRFELDLPKLYYRNNEEMMEHVWLNLISNAVKFSREGGLIQITGRKEETEIMIQVRDYGIGIATDALEHIFEEFFQADTAHASEGSGLGLSLVHKIVELSGGTICVESCVGEGTVFEVRLPLLET